MQNCLKFLLVLAMVIAPWAAGAQGFRINPVPPGVKPQWTKIPGAPQIYWAPNLPTDVFRYRGAYYFFWSGYFYRGRSPQGPWTGVEQVPKVFYAIHPFYFKTLKVTKEPPTSIEPTPLPRVSPSPSPDAPAPEPLPKVM